MILLSAGHYPAAPGACSIHDQSFCEHQEAVEWCNLLRANLLAMGVECELVPTGGLTSKVNWINQRKASVCVEIHFNSSPGGKGKGSETLYAPGSLKGLVAAELIQEALEQIFPPGRGAKEGWYRMDVPGKVDYAGDVDGDEKPDYFLHKTRWPSVIIEPEFIHNKEVIQAKRQLACLKLADVLKGLDHE